MFLGVVSVLFLAISCVLIRRCLKANEGTVYCSLQISLSPIIIIVPEQRKDTLDSTCNRTISLQNNLAYGTCGEMENSAHLTGLLPQQQVMELTQNQAYISNIPVNANRCYGIATPSVDSDCLHATVEGEYDYIQYDKLVVAKV